MEFSSNLLHSDKCYMGWGRMRELYKSEKYIYKNGIVSPVGFLLYVLLVLYRNSIFEGLQFIQISCRFLNVVKDPKMMENIDHPRNIPR